MTPQVPPPPRRPRGGGMALALAIATCLPACAAAPAATGAAAFPRGSSFALAIQAAAPAAGAPAPALGAPDAAAAPVGGGAPQAPAGRPALIPPAAPPPGIPAPGAASRGGSGGGSSGRGSSGRGGSGGGTPAPAPTPEPPRLPILVADEHGLPVAGAAVRFGDGTEVVSDEHGEIGVWPAFPGQRVEVRAEGFVRSTAFDLATADRLHLRRDGTLPVAAGDHAATLLGAFGADVASAWVRYAGDPAATGPVRYMAADGTFALPVVTVAPGAPRGVLHAEATSAAGDVLFGLSPTFAPFADPVPALAFVAASRRIAYDVVAAPPDLGIFAARCELERPDGAAVLLAVTPDRAGTFLAVLDGSWPGTRTRVVLTARAGGGLRESVAAIAPAADRAEASLLDPPAVAVDADARQVAWTAVVGAKGYRVEVRRDAAGAPAWEAFTATGLAVTVPEDAWPGAGGAVVVQAIDAPGLTSRTLAAVADGPRRLRVEPWTSAATYRVATTRARL